MIRLLIADDSETIRRAIGKMLDAEPAITVVAEAGNYAELVARFDESSPDVVLMDVRMPGLPEPEPLKAHLLRSCVLAMSFWSNEETASLAASFGAVRLLDKTKLVSDLVPAIKECMRQAGASSPRS